jgi:hypothetical protein
MVTRTRLDVRLYVHCVLFIVGMTRNNTNTLRKQSEDVSALKPCATYNDQQAFEDAKSHGENTIHFPPLC